MSLVSRPNFLLALAVVVLAVSPPVGFAADEELPDRVGGLGYNDAYDQTTVRIDVFVRDDEGNPVPGLSQDHFRLVQDGTEMPITTFTAYAQLEPEDPASGSVSLLPEDSPEPEDDISKVPSDPVYVVLYIDNQNSRYAERNRVVRALRDFFNEGVGGPAQIMVVTYDGTTHIVQPFTDDRRAVAHALRQVRTQEAARDDLDDEHLGIQVEIRRAEKAHYRSRDTRYRALSEIYSKIHDFAQDEDARLGETLGALRNACTALAGIDGRKYLVYVSSGLPLTLVPELLHQFAGLDTRGTADPSVFARSKKKQYDAIADSANSQGLTIHAIDATGADWRKTQIGDSDSRRAASAAVIAHENLQAPLRILAEETGGMAVLNTDDFSGELDRIRTTLRTYYTLGYDSNSSESDTVHYVDVELLTESEYDIHYRQTLVEKSIESRVQDEVTSGLFFDLGRDPLGIRFAAGQQVKATEDRWQVPIAVYIPVTSLAMVREGEEYVGRAVHFLAIRDLEGRHTDMQRQSHTFRLTVEEYEDLKEEAFPIYIRLLLESGRHKIVVGVLDEETHQVSILTLQTRSPDAK